MQEAMEISVQFKLQLPVKIKKRAKWFVASCTILDVHSQGETQAKAKKNLVEALSLFLISCFERGTLGTVLKTERVANRRNYDLDKS